ncbi:MAG: peptide-methionine (S)-S-oxide reductase MsrA [Candidatus Dojkabacteria bacterium]|jgi:peptide-methionine (S)-S-oxide reductase|nr:peptide-methionine (S)-S-oxide reductase MsrA [Candidatus Dojkabacteria bacterium]
MEEVIFGGGCFWCLEAIFQRIEGIETVTPGYAGGNTDNPTYEEVSTGDTGHAEVVNVKFNPNKITLEQVLTIFFLAHDPTTLNRQGADTGTQYRSIILYTNDKQRKIIEEVMKKAQGKYNNPIVTEIKELDRFYQAEEYHLDYYGRNPNVGYCRLIIKPKLEKILDREKRLY